MYIHDYVLLSSATSFTMYTIRRSDRPLSAPSFRRHIVVLTEAGPSVDRCYSSYRRVNKEHRFRLEK